MQPQTCGSHQLVNAASAAFHSLHCGVVDGHRCQGRVTQELYEDSGEMHGQVMICQGSQQPMHVHCKSQQGGESVQIHPVSRVCRCGRDAGGAACPLQQCRGVAPLLVNMPVHCGRQEGRDLGAVLHGVSTQHTTAPDDGGSKVHRLLHCAELHMQRWDWGALMPAQAFFMQM